MRATILFLLLVASIPAWACGIDITPREAAQMFAEARAVSKRDGGRLWGKSLYGPMLFVQPATRFVAANQADPGGLLKPLGDVWIGRLPANVPMANTAVEWSGARWTMVLWPLPSDPADRARLLAHEMFHRIQPDLGFKTTDPLNAHLDSLDGRYWLQLEWRALAKALLSNKQSRLRACRDALLFRAMRRKIFPESGERERALEMNEGLAEYTGVSLRPDTESARRLYTARSLEPAAAKASYVRSFAYATGPAYGLLLDEIHPDWNRAIGASDDLASILAREMRIRIPASPEKEAKSRAETYDGIALRQAEETRERQRLERVARYRAQLVDGPVLELPLRAINFSFDPNTVVPLEGVGTIYPTLTASDWWGHIQASAGALISPDFKRLLIPCPRPPGSETKGESWTLSLNSGWKIVPGKRAGDYLAVRE